MNAQNLQKFGHKLEVFIQKLYLSYSLFSRNELQNHAGAASYSFLLSVVPVIALFVLLFNNYLRHYPDFSEQFFAILKEFNGQLDKSLLDKIGLHRISMRALGLFGILSLFWSSRLVLQTLIRAFCVIFPSKKSRHILLDQALPLLVVPLIFSLVVIAVLAKLITGFFNETIMSLFGSHSLLAYSTIIISKVLPAAIGFSLIYFSYRYIPIERPSRRSALQGASLCALSMFALKSLFSLMIDAARLNLFYGLIGSLILLLIWVYFVFMLYFLFAEFTYCAEKIDVLLLDKILMQQVETKPSAIDSWLFKNNTRLLKKYGRRLDADAVVFSANDSSSEIFFVYEGELGAYRQKSADSAIHRVSTIRQGEIFGEMAYLLGENRSATVRCDNPVILLVLTPAMFEGLLHVNTQLSRQTISVLCQRLRHSSNAQQTLPEPTLSATSDPAAQEIN